MPEFLVLNKQRKHAIDSREIRRFLKQLVPALGIVSRVFSVVLTTDEVIRHYNHTYRGFDKATDVLSFEGDAGYLGDILISVETAYNQARQSRKLSLTMNLHRLMLHGLLHLMGYDHEVDNGEMRSMERRLRRKFGC